MAAAVRRLMAKKPEDRFASAGELAATLERIGDGLADTTATGSWTEGLPTGTPAPRRRTGWAWLYAVLGILIVGMASVLGWELWPLLTPRGGQSAAAKSQPPLVPPPAPTAQATLLFEADDGQLRLIARRKGQPEEAHEAKPGEPLSLDSGDYDLELGPEADGGLRLSSREVSLAPAGQATVRVENEAVALNGLVSRPAAIEGVRNWTISTHHGRGSVLHLAYSPDGKWLAEVHEDNVVRLLTPAREFVRAFVVRGTGVRALAWSPLSADQTDPVLAVVSVSGGVRAWSATTGRLVFDLRDSSAAAAWSEDGNTLAIASGMKCAAVGRCHGSGDPDAGDGRTDPRAGMVARRRGAGRRRRRRRHPSLAAAGLDGGGPQGARRCGGRAGLVVEFGDAGLCGEGRRHPPLAGRRRGGCAGAHCDRQEGLRTLAWIKDKTSPIIASCGEAGPQEPSVQLWSGLTGKACPR